MGNFKNGDIVVDTKFNECFPFTEENTRFIIDRLRIATKEEAELFKKSGKEFISLNTQ